MNAGKNIGSRICTVKHLNGKSKNIVTLKGSGPEQMSVGVYGRHHQKQRHSRKQENTVLIKFPFLIKLEKQINKNGSYIHKPQKVRHDKPFRKRNQVVQAYMNHMVRQVRPALKP